MSMQEQTFLNNIMMSKIEAVAIVCNFLVDELMERATRLDEVRNYYDIAVIGYSGDCVRSMLPHTDHNNFIAIDRLAQEAPTPRSINFEQRNERGYCADAQFTLREWIKPEAHGKTPMFQALSVVYRMVEEWCSKPDNRLSFPPIIFHITDGDCNDAEDNDLRSIAQSIRSVATQDGNTLLINIHLSPYDEAPSEIFPTEGKGPNPMPHYALLYDMASTIPQQLNHLVSTIAQPAGPGPYRAVAYNTSPCELLSILNIGSESINLE
jgi:uncharacterized protein YegL